MIKGYDSRSRGEVVTQLEEGGGICAASAGPVVIHHPGVELGKSIAGRGTRMCKVLSQREFGFRELQIAPLARA